MTWLISYNPAGFPFKNFAAAIAPLAKIALEYAEWEKVTTSSVPAKITSCSPTMLPPLTAEKPISFSGRFALLSLLSKTYSYKQPDQESVKPIALSQKLYTFLWRLWDGKAF